MSSTKNPGRFAGVLYLLLSIPAVFALLYVPNKLIVSGNATATANSIAASESLFRLGIVSGLVTSVIFIFVALALYRLLKAVNQNLAVLMVVLVLISVPIAFLNELNNIAALTLLSGAGYLSVFRTDQLQALALLFLGLNSYGNIIAQIFWGLWLFPFGLLVFRSRFIPRILGVWLIINCFAYLAISFTALLLPDYRELVFRAAMPALLGELAIMLWLLIVGAKQQPLNV